MSRYRKVREISWDDEGLWDAEGQHYRPLVPYLEVPDHIGRWTGLYDSEGDKIYRDPRPIGFGRDDEW